MCKGQDYFCTADSKALFPPFTGSEPLFLHRNADIWPKTHHLGPKDFTTWLKFLKKVFTVIPLKLPSSLGKWYQHSNQSPAWDKFLSTCSTFLFHYVDSKWFRHVKCPNSHRLFHKASLLLSQSPSMHIHRASVICFPHHYHLTNQDTSPLTSRPSTPIISFGDLSFTQPQDNLFFSNIRYSTSTT